MAVRPTLAVILFCAIAGLILCGIAYGTNTWREYIVDYSNPGVAGIFDTESPNYVKPENRAKMFYSRSYGFFRECFDKTYDQGM